MELFPSSLTPFKLRTFSLTVEICTFGHSKRYFRTSHQSRAAHYCAAQEKTSEKHSSGSHSTLIWCLFIPVKTLLLVADDFSLHVYSFLISDTRQFLHISHCLFLYYLPVKRGKARLSPKRLLYVFSVLDYTLQIIKLARNLVFHTSLVPAAYGRQERILPFKDDNTVYIC